MAHLATKSLSETLQSVLHGISCASLKSGVLPISETGEVKLRRFPDGQTAESPSVRALQMNQPAGQESRQPGPRKRLYKKRDKKIWEF